MARERVVAVVGAACVADRVVQLADSGAVVIVWSADAGHNGRLVALVRQRGGRAASFTGAASARSELEAFAVEVFGGLDEIVGADEVGAGEG